MTFEKTLYSFCESFCKSKYGQDVGTKLFNATEKLYNELCERTDDRNSKGIRWHLDNNMLPVIAFYKTIKEHYNDTEHALGDTDELMQIMRIKAKEKNQSLGSMACGYSLFKMFVKKHMKSSYPPEGWNTEWVRRDSREVHFNMKSCIYVDITKELDCSELCFLFCKNDEVTMSGFLPSIKFERQGTLALGNDVCDFHYLNTKKLDK